MVFQIGCHLIRLKSRQLNSLTSLECRLCTFLYVPNYATYGRACVCVCVRSVVVGRTKQLCKPYLSNVDAPPAPAAAGRGLLERPRFLRAAADATLACDFLVNVFLASSSEFCSVNVMPWSDPR